MKANLSVLLTELSGSAGPVTASRWKGRQYFRAKVTPANPNTAGQQAVRESMARTVELYQSTVSKVKASWGLWASTLTISGFNWWVKANRAQEQASAMEAYTPPNSDREPPTTFAAVTGAGSGQIDLTWAVGLNPGTDIAHVAVRLDGTNAWVVATDAVTLIGDQAYTITGLTPGETYYVVLAGRDADDLFTPCVFDSAVAGV